MTDSLPGLLGSASAPPPARPPRRRGVKLGRLLVAVAVMAAVVVLAAVGLNAVLGV